MHVQLHGWHKGVHTCTACWSARENGAPQGLRAGHPLQHCTWSPELWYVTNSISQLNWKKGLCVFQPIRPPTLRTFWTVSCKSSSKPELSTRLSSGCPAMTARHKVSTLTHSPRWKLPCSMEILAAQPAPAPKGERSTEFVPPPPTRRATGPWRPLAPNLLLILCLSLRPKK